MRLIVWYEKIKIDRQEEGHVYWPVTAVRPATANFEKHGKHTVISNIAVLSLADIIALIISYYN